MKKKWLLILLSVFMMIISTIGLAACGDTGGGNSGSGHVHSYSAAVTAPTRTEGGYTTYTCDCGDSYTADVTGVVGHSYTNYVSNDDATCTEDGTETATCDYGCGTTDTRTDEESAGHDYTVYVEEKTPATCTINRVDTYQCERCTETTDLEMDGTAGHNYDQQVVEEKYKAEDATCKAKAIYYYSCKCGEKGDMTFEKGTFANHEIENGKCTICGYQESQGLEYELSADGTYYIVTDIGSCGCSSLTTVVIPNSVTSIGDRAFYDCDSLTRIYCEATSEPSGWNSDWNYDYGGRYYPVVWGYTGN